MSGFCPDCGNTGCECDEITKATYPFRMDILELEKKLAISEEINRGLANRNHGLKMMVHECDSEIALRGENFNKLKEEMVRMMDAMTRTSQSNFALKEKLDVAKEALEFYTISGVGANGSIIHYGNRVREALLKLKEMEG